MKKNDVDEHARRIARQEKASEWRLEDDWVADAIIWRMPA